MAIKKISANLLGSNAVLAANIAGGAISAADIADNSITAAKISASTSPTFGDITAGDITAQTGGLTVGTSDTTGGVITVHGNGTGNAEGGEIRLSMAADHDSTYDFYRIDVVNDSFRIGRAGTTDLTINSSGNASFNGTITSGTSTITRDALAGNLITFNNSNGEIGSIETQGDEMVLMSVDRGLRIRTSTSNSIIPVGTSRTNLDDTVSLGSSGARFTTLYLSDNVLNWGKAGSVTVFNEDGTTADFRIESDTKPYMFFLDGGLNRIGINTNAPSHTLHILNEVSSDTIDETNGLVKMQSSGGNGMIFGTIASSPYSSYIQSAYVQDTSLAQYDLALNPVGGKVRIGAATGSITSMLEIDSAINASLPSLLTLKNTGLTGAGTLQIAAPGGGSAFATGSAVGDIVIRNTTTGGSLFLTAKNAVRLGVGGTDGDTRVLVDSSGNVGIGTDNPTGAKLHVVGGVKATDLIAHDSTGINLQTDEGTKRLIINDLGRIHIGTGNTFNAGLTVSNGDIRTSGAAFANDANSIAMSYEGSSSGGGLSVRGPNSTTRGKMFLSVNEGDGGNGRSGIIIETDGQVRMQYQPSFLIGTPNPSSAGNVWKSNTIFHNNGSHWNNTTGRFTAPVAGYYFFFHWGMLTAGQTTTDADVYSRLNGSRDQIGTAYSGAQGGNYLIFNANYIRYLNVNDYVDVYISSGTVYNNNDGRHGHFGGYLIG